MMWRYTFDQAEAADRIELAVNDALNSDIRTADIYTEGMHKVSTSEMADAVIKALKVRRKNDKKI